MPRANPRPCRHRTRPRNNAARLLPAALALAMLTWLTGCTEVSQMFARAEPAPEPQVVEQPAAPAPIPDPQEKPKPGKLYEWYGDGRRVSHIVVDTDDQKARFYDGDEQIGWTTVASGVSKRPTPVGEFEIMEKVRDKRSNLYGKIVNKSGKTLRSGATMGKTPIPAGGRFLGASMPYFMRLTYDGVGMHAGPIPRPGRPASHGCIRMPRKMAPILYKHTDLGTRVSIVGKGPDYGNYAVKQRQLAAERAALAATEAEQQPRQGAAAATTVASAAEPARRPERASTTARRSYEKSAPAAAVASVAAAADTPAAESAAPSSAPEASSAATTTKPSSPATTTRTASASSAPDTASTAAPKPAPQPTATATAAAPAPGPAPVAPRPMPIAPVPVIPAGAYTPAPMIQSPAPGAPRPTPAPAVATSSASAGDSGSTETNQSADDAN